MSEHLRELIAFLCLAAPADWRVEHAGSLLSIEDDEAMQQLVRRGIVTWEPTIRAGVEVARITPAGERLLRNLVTELLKATT